jgi:hypothetical protein
MNDAQAYADLIERRAQFDISLHAADAIGPENAIQFRGFLTQLAAQHRVERGCVPASQHTATVLAAETLLMLEEFAARRSIGTQLIMAFTAALTCLSPAPKQLDMFGRSGVVSSFTKGMTVRPNSPQYAGINFEHGFFVLFSSTVVAVARLRAKLPQGVSVIAQEGSILSCEEMSRKFVRGAASALTTGRMEKLSRMDRSDLNKFQMLFDLAGIREPVPA